MASDTKPTPALICLGAFAGAHGVRGEVRVKTFTQDPMDLAAYGPVQTEDGRQHFDITAITPDKIGARVRLAGITNREQAQSLKGTRIYISRSALPASDDEDDFYHADLLGLVALDAQGGAWGRVIGVHNFGAEDLLEIKADKNTDTQFIPFTKEYVPDIHLEKGTLTALPVSMVEPENNEENEKEGNAE
ncbi:MAG: ribosome maturation factor RimM [Parvibaculales bacterium]